MSIRYTSRSSLFSPEAWIHPTFKACGLSPPHSPKIVKKIYIACRADEITNMATEYQITITRPCTDAPGRFIAESSFGRKFAMSSVCEKVRDIHGAKCSESLGVAKFDYRDWTFIIYRSGRADIRKVTGEDDARKAMGELESLFVDAFEGT